MPLTNDDLQKITEIVRTEVQPLAKRLDTIDGRLIAIENRLEAIEKWIPVDNTYILKKLVTM